MKNKFYLPQISIWLVLAILCMPLVSIGQMSKSKDEISFDYDVNSLSLLLLEFKNDRLPEQVKSQFVPHVSEKFFLNPLGTNRIQVEWERPSPEEASNSQSSTKKKLNKFLNSFSKSDTTKQEEVAEHEKIRQTLEANNVGAGILELWSKQSDNGRFVTLEKRVDKNYSAIASLGSEDKDKLANIKPLFFRNYLLVFDFQKFSDAESTKKYSKVRKRDGELDGYTANAVVYFYKLDIDEKLFEGFIKPNFRNKQKLKDYNYPVKYVRKHKFTVSKFRSNAQLSGKTKTDEQLIKEVMDELFRKAIFHAEQHIDDFKAKDFIYEISPQIKGTVGKLQGVKVDQRFYVYQKQMKNNTIKTKRVAMLRATNNIGDNLTKLKDDEGNYITTSFRKTFGQQIEEGMLLVQEKDRGLSLAAGPYFRGESTDIGILLTLNISPFLHHLGESVNFSGSRFFIDMSFGKRPLGDATFNGDKSSATRIGLGVSKDLLLSRFVDIVPYGGYYFYSLSDDDDARDRYLKVGVRIPISVYYNTYLVGDIGVTSESEFTGTSRFPISMMLRVDF